MAHAAVQYAKIDKSAPENFSTIAAYRAYEGDYFAGLCEMSPHPGVMSADLSKEMRHAYETYAASLCEDVGMDGKMEELPSSEEFPSQLV